ncbi:MAG: hypothetical protein ACRDUB_18755, partial [Mycobacterium sp.]
MTDIADNPRRELMRRKLAERGLSAAEAAGPTATGLSDGQQRMWFVQSVDPSGVLLNVCVSYRLTGPVDPERLHAAV